MALSRTGSDTSMPLQIGEAQTQLSKQKTLIVATEERQTMPFCQQCGTNIGEDALLCTPCSMSPKSPSGQLLAPINPVIPRQYQRPLLRYVFLVVAGAIALYILIVAMGVRKGVDQAVQTGVQQGAGEGLQTGVKDTGTTEVSNASGKAQCDADLEALFNHNVDKQKTLKELVELSDEFDRCDKAYGAGDRRYFTGSAGCVGAIAIRYQHFIERHGFNDQFLKEDSEGQR
jgi:hypothetical protein